MKGKEKKGCCDKEKTRRELVAAALTQAYFTSDTERQECIDLYSKADLTIEQILMITAPLREIHSGTAKGKSKIFGSNNTAMGGVY